MNTTNDLEMQLRSWNLRRPSAKVRNKLFGCRREEFPSAAAFRLQWLAPAAAALVVMSMVLVQRNNPAISGGTNAAPVVALIPSNQFAASIVSDSLSNPAYSAVSAKPPCLGRTFDWTNGRGSTSSISSLSGARGKD